MNQQITTPMVSILDQISFILENNRIVADITPKSTSEAGPVIETLNEVTTNKHVWQSAINTIDGKNPFPYWHGGDSMEIKVEKDGTWFREQEEWRHSKGTKLPNADARELMSQFMEAGMKLAQ